RAHADFIQRIANPAHTIGRERGTRRAVQDHVTIGARYRAVTGVESLRNLARPERADLRRQVGRRAQNPGTLGARGLRIEVDDLHAGVHAGIGPTGRRDFDWVIRDAGERPFDDRLDPHSVRLRLPVAEGRAVVLQAEGDSGYLIDSIRRCASCFWLALPSDSTSSRMLRAPSGSPMSM